MKNLIVSPDPLRTDFLILGAGVAGISLALKLASVGSVALVCKETLFDCNTSWAQGGIASAIDQRDSYENHAADTLKAGVGLCHENVVRKVVEAGPEAVEELQRMGMPFTPKSECTDHGSSILEIHADTDDLHLTREGGHSHRRVVHSADTTGFALQNTLTQQLQAHPNIVVYQHHTAIDLVVTDKAMPDFSRNKALGAYVLDQACNQIVTFLARATILATGGLGSVYLHTTNPAVATGDGVAMAWRAGARVANLEFMQFHPTCLYAPSLEKTFLITEALRGEGALLKTAKTKERFMMGVHPMAELAPRDVVARTIDSVLKATGDPYVLLDISHKDPDFIRQSFPHIYETCKSIGIDMTRDPIPVVPAAHYSCGGVVTDTRGRTGIKCLWALGEVACTGLHGANRLASNSLLEGLVFAQFVYNDIVSLKEVLLKAAQPSPVPLWQLGAASHSNELVLISELRSEIQRTMWHYVGIVRTDRRLERAAARIRQINADIEHDYWNVLPNRLLIEVRNLALVAKLTIACARMRKESRGTHYSLDYSHQNDMAFGRDTILV